MRFTKPGLSEGALAAHFEYLCALKGSERPAYVPVVASGSNALVIHYTANDQLLKPGDLVLVDAGCELKFVRGGFTMILMSPDILCPLSNHLKWVCF